MTGRADDNRPRGARLGGALSVVVVVLMVACGFGWGFNHTRHDNLTIVLSPSATGPTTTVPDPAVTSAALERALLARADFPAGWASEGAESDGGEADRGASIAASGGPSCLQDLDFISLGLGEADVTLDYGSTQLPSISEYLYSAPDRTAGVFTKMVQTVAGCGVSSFEAAGASFKGQFDPITLTGAPAGTAAFAGLFTTEGATFGEDLVFVRRGDDILSLSDSDTGAPRLVQVRNATLTALAKLAQAPSPGSTTPGTTTPTTRPR